MWLRGPFRAVRYVHGSGLPRPGGRYTDRVMSPQLSEIARTDRQTTPETHGDEPDATGASARLLTGLTAVGAVVLAAALFAEPVTAAGLAPWTIVAVLALVLFLVSLAGFAAAAWGRVGRRRGLLRIGGLSGLAALAVVAIAVAIRVFLPLPLQGVLVQFSDLAGRVQIEYCPTLPQSFAGSITAADLHGSSAVVPVKVSGEVCGSNEFPQGLWLYLVRSSVTLGAE